MTRLCAVISQYNRGEHQDETDISTPELVQHMLVVEDGLSRPNISRKNKLLRGLLLVVLCGAVVVTVISDLSILAGGEDPADSVLERIHNTTQ